jgi:hypothetical protein
MPLRQLRMYIERTRQKRKALHMLSLSGVVRPSHVELRYAIPRLNIEDQSRALHEESGTAVQPSSFLQKFFDLMNWPKNDGSPGQYLSNNNRLRLRQTACTGLRSSP